MSNEKELETVQKRIQDRKMYLTYEEAEERYQLCDATIRKMAKECNALYKIGRAARIKADVFEKYLETFLDES